VVQGRRLEDLLEDQQQLQHDHEHQHSLQEKELQEPPGRRSHLYSWKFCKDKRQLKIKKKPVNILKPFFKYQFQVIDL